MKKRKVFYSLAVAGVSLITCVGIVYAATYDVTSLLGGTDGDFFDVQGTMMFDSIKVGRQGEGGVTFFNGTIINNTTGEGDSDIPVTFGDNVRIDGRVWRGATSGTDDGSPFIVLDDMEVVGFLTIGSLASANVITSTNIADGEVATADLADDAVTQTGQSIGTDTQTTTTNPNEYDLLTTEVDITTGASTLFINFSGVLANDFDAGTARVFLVLDDEIVSHTIRRGTSTGGDEPFSLAFTALVDVEVGDHTVQVGWNTNDVGSTASMFNHTLDVMELKK